MGKSRTTSEKLEKDLSDKSYKLRKYIKRYVAVKHGKLCQWTQERRVVTGLGDFFNVCPWWATVIMWLFKKIDDDVRFSLADCERAVKDMKVQGYHYEARKIYNLLAAVRQVKREPNVPLDFYQELGGKASGPSHTVGEFGDFSTKKIKNKDTKNKW